MVRPWRRKTHHPFHFLSCCSLTHSSPVSHSTFWGSPWPGASGLSSSNYAALPVLPTPGHIFPLHPGTPGVLVWPRSLGRGRGCEISEARPHWAGLRAPSGGVRTYRQPGHRLSAGCSSRSHSVRNGQVSNWYRGWLTLGKKLLNSYFSLRSFQLDQRFKCKQMLKKVQFLRKSRKGLFRHDNCSQVRQRTLATSDVTASPQVCVNPRRNRILTSHHPNPLHKFHGTERSYCSSIS